MKGFSFYLPFIIIATLLKELSLLFIEHIEIAEFFSFSSYFLFQLTYVVLAGFIAYAIGDKLALLPGLLGGFLAIRYDQGFLAALLLGLIAGYMILVMKSIINKSPHQIKQTLTVVWIPLVSIIIIYATSEVLTLFMPQFSYYYETFFSGLSPIAGAIIATILACMMAYDLGGPVNKLAYIFAISTIGLTERNVLIPAVMLGGMVPTIAIGLYHMLFKHKFESQSQTKGINVLLSGVFFVSEAGLPFYYKYGKKVMIPSIIGSAVAAIIIGYKQVISFVPHGGLLMFWTTSNALVFIYSMIAGIVVSLFGLIILNFKNNEKINE
jgi:PTS system fructose-specific IIC component